MGNLIEFDSTFFIQLANFLVTLIVLNFLLIKPVRTQIATRKAFTSGLGADIAHFTQQADAKLAGYEETLAAARTEAGKARDAAKAEGAKREQEVLAKAQGEVQAFLQTARAETAREMKAAGDALSGRVNAFAAQAIARILG